MSSNPILDMAPHECGMKLKDIGGALEQCQDRLGSLLASVDVIHQRASRLYASAHNRQLVLRELDQLATKLYLSESQFQYTIKRFSKTILEQILQTAPVDRHFQQVLLLLDNALEAAQLYSESGIMAAHDALVKYSEIADRASHKVSQFLQSRISELGVSISNLNALQVVLAHYAPMYAVVRKRATVRASEIRTKYSALASGYYFKIINNAFKQLGLKKMALTKSTRYLIGEQQSNSGEERKRGASLFYKANPLTPAEELSKALPQLPFTKHQSASVVTTNNNTFATRSSISVVAASVLVSRQQGQSEFVSNFDVTFRLIADIIKVEHRFINQFFPQDLDIAMTCLGKALDAFKQMWSEKLQVCFDLVELVSIQMKTQEHVDDLALLEDRFVSSYGELVADMILDRINMVIKAHVQSLNEAFSNITATLDIHVTGITRRYAEQLRLVLATCPEHPHPKLIDSLQLFQREMDVFLEKLAGTLATTREQSLFLINNYDHIYAMLENLHKKDTLLDTQTQRQISKRLNEIVGSFAEDELEPYFPSLFLYLNRLELGLEPSTTNAKEQTASSCVPIECEQAQLIMLDKLVVEFNKTVAERLRSLNIAIITSFSHFRTAASVLGVMYGRLIEEYEGFLKHIDNVYGKKPRGQNTVEPMSIEALKSLVRQYQPNFV